MSTVLSFGENVNIHPTSHINYVQFGDNVKVTKECLVNGSENHIVKIGDEVILAMYSVIDGTHADITFGNNSGLGQHSMLISHWEIPESSKISKLFPVKAAPIIVGSDTWIGSGCIVAPGVTIGRCCIIASNSYVDSDVPDYSIFGGSPAKLIRKIDPEELELK